jgi:hypothetical protein
MSFAERRVAHLIKVWQTGLLVCKRRVEKMREILLYILLILILFMISQMCKGGV